jgi:hypothetical protein
MSCAVLCCAVLCPQVYCLPDNYEVVDRSLDDIRAVLNPAFTTEVGSSVLLGGFLELIRCMSLGERVPEVPEVCEGRGGCGGAYCVVCFDSVRGKKAWGCSDRVCGPQPG